MKSFLITGIDPELHKKFKSACDFSGTTMRDVLIQHMRYMAAKHIADLISQEKGKQTPKKGGKKA